MWSQARTNVGLRTRLLTATSVTVALATGSDGMLLLPEGPAGGIVPAFDATDPISVLHTRLANEPDMLSALARRALHTRQVLTHRMPPVPPDGFAHSAIPVLIAAGMHHQHKLSAVGFDYEQMTDLAHHGNTPLVQTLASDWLLFTDFAQELIEVLPPVTA